MKVKGTLLPSQDNAKKVRSRSNIRIRDSSTSRKRRRLQEISGTSNRKEFVTQPVSINEANRPFVYTYNKNHSGPLTVYIDTMSLNNETLKPINAINLTRLMLTCLETQPISNFWRYRTLWNWWNFVPGPRTSYWVVIQTLTTQYGAALTSIESLSFYNCPRNSHKIMIL